MSLLSRIWRFSAATAVTSLAMFGANAQASGAGPSTATGYFLTDDQVQLIDLNLSVAGVLDVKSIGYAGGQTPVGTFAAGGFDTMLFLFDSSGAFLTGNDDGIDSIIDPATGLASDAHLVTGALAPGHYTLALTEYDNTPLGSLADGFSRQGQGNFTPTLSGVCNASAFCDWQGNSRTGFYALEISLPVPEPSSASLMISALLLGAAYGANRRRRQDDK